MPPLTLISLSYHSLLLLFLTYYYQDAKDSFYDFQGYALITQFIGVDFCYDLSFGKIMVTLFDFYH